MQLTSEFAPSRSGFAVILVFAFACGENSRNAGRLVFGVHPHAAHRVMHGGENFHGFVPRIDAEEFFVDFENAFELAVERFARDVRDVEINGSLTIEPKLFLIDDAMNRARCDVARDEVAVLRIPLFQEIEAFSFGDASWRALLLGIPRHPDAAAFATRRFAH